jgi:aspartate/methionine/tyrosine aminotransferase
MTYGYDSQYLALEEAAHKISHIDLTSCDPPLYGFLPEKSVIEAAISALQKRTPWYGDFRGEASFLQSIRKYCIERGGTPTSLLVTHGVSEGFTLLAHAATGAVLLPDPTYIPLYETISFSQPVQFYPLEESDRWSLHEDSLRQSITDETRFLVIINPNSPTGAVFSKKELKKVVDIAGEYDLVLATDEIYDGLSFVPFTSLLSLSKDVPLIYYNGISKTHRLPGFRIGYMVLSDPEEKITDLWSRIEHLARIRLSVSPVFQVAAAQALHCDCTDFCASVKSHRDFCMDHLQNLGLDIAPSQGTPYGFPSIPRDDWTFVHRLLNRGVFTTPGSSYGPVIGPGHFRFVFLQQPSVLKKAFHIIDEVLQSWR